jgi:hypothetical protein
MGLFFGPLLFAAHGVGMLDEDLHYVALPPRTPKAFSLDVTTYGRVRKAVIAATDLQGRKVLGARSFSLHSERIQIVLKEVTGGSFTLSIVHAGSFAGRSRTPKSVVPITGCRAKVGTLDGEQPAWIANKAACSSRVSTTLDLFLRRILRADNS